MGYTQNKSLRTGYSLFNGERRQSHGWNTSSVRSCTKTASVALCLELRRHDNLRQLTRQALHLNLPMVLSYCTIEGRVSCLHKNRKLTRSVRCRRSLQGNKANAKGRAASPSHRLCQIAKICMYPIRSRASLCSCRRENSGGSSGAQVAPEENYCLYEEPRMQGLHDQLANLQVTEVGSYDSARVVQEIRPKIATKSSP